MPISEEVKVPYDYHRYVIGAKGAGVRQMMEDYDVSLVPIFKFYILHSWCLLFYYISRLV